MSRIRTIKPEFFKHEELFEAEQESGLPLRLAFAGLWTQCDREGRFVWRPRQLKIDILPYDEIDFSRVLDALATRGFIVKFEAENKAFGFVPSWQRHQVINNRETASAIPNPAEIIAQSDASTTRQSRVGHAGKAEGKGKEGKEEPNGSLSETSSDQPKKAKKKNTYTADFEAFWIEYPRTPNMGKAETFAVWRKLDDDDRSAARAAIPAFKAFLAAHPDLSTLHACRFLSKRRFEGFAAQATEVAAIDAGQWVKRLDYGRRHQKWSDSWGARPGQPGCQVPANLIQPNDGADWRSMEAAA